MLPRSDHSLLQLVHPEKPMRSKEYHLLNANAVSIKTQFLYFSLSTAQLSDSACEAVLTIKAINY